MKMLNVVPMDLALQTMNLSGGNQQKIVIAKWLSAQAKVLIMDEPTRGIDVGAKDEIYKLMLDLTGKGISIIMSLSHRILVIHEGKICWETTPAEATEESILHYAMGGKDVVQ